MNRQTKPRIAILYHFFYPDDVVSARHLSQYAADLAQRGWDVTALTSNRYCRYPDHEITKKQEKWGEINIVRVWRPRWNQANRYLRLLNSIWMMLAWSFALLRMKRFDVIVIGTDPQFGALMFPLLRLLKRGRLLVHWCYDLYPEAIIADGAQGVSKWLARFSFHVMRWAYHYVDIMVDIGPYMREKLSAYRHRATVATLVPWALTEPEKLPLPDSEVREGLFGRCELSILYSGNLGHAHDFDLLLELARRVGEKSDQINFVFAGRGNKWPALEKAVELCGSNVRIAPFAEESELQKRLCSADIHMASLRPEWSGVVVPSKFFGSLAVGRPVIYAGSVESDIAQWILEFQVGWVLNEKTLDEVANDLLMMVGGDGRKLSSLQHRTHITYQKFSRSNVMDGWDTLLRQQLKTLRDS